MASKIAPNSLDGGDLATGFATLGTGVLGFLNTQATQDFNKFVATSQLDLQALRNQGQEGAAKATLALATIQQEGNARQLKAQQEQAAAKAKFMISVGIVLAALTLGLVLLLRRPKPPLP